jgi:putative addiction module component (TIGR02574 family)
MPLTFDQIREEVLALPNDQQLEIADTVYCCAEPAHPQELHPSWAEELQRRSDELHTGRSVGIPWEEVELELDRIIDGR